jgi:phage shock protein E
MKKKVKYFLGLYFSLLFISCQAQTANDLNAATFQQKIESTKDAIVLDVREQDEANMMGEIKNSIRIDYYQEHFEKELDKLDPKKTYFVYCAGGVRSKKTCNVLSKKGFKQVYNLSGGFASWEAAKLPVINVTR